jgi:uncharacterized protein
MRTDLVHRRPHRRDAESRTVDVDVEALDARGRTVTGYAAVYDRESGDLGGFRERIAPGAFAGVLDSDVRCLLNHNADQLLGRTRAGTLRLSDDPRGLRFECDLPESRSDLAEAVERGDLDGASFRFEVADDEWEGDLRTIREVRALHDVSLATHPAYPAASVELRTAPAGRSSSSSSRDENGFGGLEIRDRGSRPRAGESRRERSLADEFRNRGFPAETATVDFGEFRAVTWSGTADELSPIARDGAALGYDERYVFPAFPRVAVDDGVTSVNVPTQTSRTLASASDVVRDIDAVTDKPETDSTLDLVTVTLNQVASVQTGVPNVYLEQPAFNSVIENDLRLAVNDGLDSLVLTELEKADYVSGSASSGIAGIRQAIADLHDNGYNPDTLILDPAAAVALDTLVADTGTEFYVFPPGQYAPTIFGLTRRISRDAAAPIVADSQAVGRLYASAVSLATFEADAGVSNTSNVRLELNAAFGVERIDAAVVVGAAGPG